MQTNMTERLLDALRQAADAHEEHEKQLGRSDPDWPQWYAEHMTRTLTADGYELSRTPLS